MPQPRPRHRARWTRHCLASAALATALVAAPCPARAQTLAVDHPPPPPPAGVTAQTTVVATTPTTLVRVEPPPDPRVRRWELGVVGGGGFLLTSRYAAVARSIGYDEGLALGTIALEFGGYLNPYLSLGLRTGYAGGDFDPEHSRSGLRPIGLGLFDGSGFVRVGLPIRLNPRERFTVGVQLEGGVAGATLWTREGGAWSPALPRFAASLVLQAQTHGPGVSARMGVQHCVWPGAGGQHVDLGMTGFFFAMGVEVGR